ncbi:hypothetical protein BJV74DRAFT_869588 [Russula compacta]|nr:hypothetical protein BJV74DRAFT_869588 [Russula compacta]
MPAVTRSRPAKKSADFYILIDKTPRNAVNKPIRTTGKDKHKSKKKALQAAPAEAKSKAKAKRPAKISSTQVDIEGENTAQPPDVGNPDDPLHRVLSTVEPPGVFTTPPHSRPPPRPPKLPEHRSHDPKTTLPPQFDYDGTPSPEPKRRHSHRVSARASSLLPPSSPIHLSSSPARQSHSELSKRNSFFLSALPPGSPSQFRTPTRGDKKRKRTPISNPHFQSEGDVNNNDLFAHGVLDDLDEREDNVDWENAGSDKENHSGLPEFPASDISDNKPAPSMPLTSERGILQPREASLSPVRSSDSDPFGFLATERLLKVRRAEKMLDPPGAGPSNRHREPRRPLGELTATEVEPAPQQSESVQAITSPSQSQRATVSPYRRYSDSEIEDLYAPASPPHTPRERLPHAHATSPHTDTTPVATAAPLTPRNGDSARAFTMRRRRQKELHGVSEHGSEIEGSSAPSSPSPVKRVHQRPPDPGSQLDYAYQESEEGRPQKRPKLRGKGKGKENARGKRWKMEVEDPMEAARRVLENAPRRKLERRTIGTRKKTPSDPVDEDNEERTRPARGRRVPRSVSGQASRSKKGSEGSRLGKKKKDESTPEDLREAREQERQKRIEYFKQLDGYELPKENVYVI